MRDVKTFGVSVWADFSIDTVVQGVSKETQLKRLWIARNASAPSALQMYRNDDLLAQACDLLPDGFGDYEAVSIASLVLGELYYEEATPEDLAAVGVITNRARALCDIPRHP